MGVILYPESRNENQCLTCNKSIPITEEFCEVCKWVTCKQCAKNLVEINGVCNSCIKEREEKNLCFACWKEPQVKDGLCNSCTRLEEKYIETADQLMEVLDG